MTESLGLRVHSFAPRGALTLMHVIQREPEATEESPKWFHHGNDHCLSSSAVILALCAGIPRMVAER